MSVKRKVTVPVGSAAAMSDLQYRRCRRADEPGIIASRWTTGYDPQYTAELAK
jgi:hypothetical protein